MYKKEFMEKAVDARFDEMMGGRSGMPAGFMEERDREMCLELFREYEGMEGVRY